MKNPLISLLGLGLLLTFTSPLSAAEPGKTQHLSSPDAVPEGLAASDWSSIRQQYEKHRHAAFAVDGGYQARNPGQQWVTKFDGRGFTTQPDAGGWQWGLELRSYGFPGEEHAISGPAQVHQAGQRVAYAWDETLQEWFVNDQRGLEHGFTVRQRPAQDPSLNSSAAASSSGAIASKSDEGGSTLNFLLAVRGSLVAQVTADGQGVQFRDAAGATVINYSGLKVWDADGKILPSRFAPASSQLSTLNSQPSTLNPPCACWWTNAARATR